MLWKKEEVTTIIVNLIRKANSFIMYASYFSNILTTLLL